VIANSVELTIRGHGYDALVGLAGCDKSLPGMMMAMLRLNVPSVFMYGGSILPGRFQGRDDGGGCVRGFEMTRLERLGNDRARVSQHGVHPTQRTGMESGCHRV
jgi:dihydroxyacid dehydratase/phosphogluconate dehydratase